MGRIFANTLGAVLTTPVTRSVQALLAAACLATFGWAQDVFRVDVQLVRILATVRDASGSVIGGLSKEHFQILDNDVEQDVALFERQTSQPLSVSILIDTSGSTGKELRGETESVSRFLRTLLGEGNPEDRASLYSFNWQIVQHVELSRRQSDFDAALRKLKGEAGTTLYDAIYLATGEIQDRTGRHVVVVVSDGGDTTSAKTYADALRALHRADAVFYAILVMPITNDAGRNVGGENALTGLARSTGGKMFSPSPNTLDSVFDEILKDLRTQYLLGFYPRNVPRTKNPFHRLSITVKNSSQAGAEGPQLRVLSRSGYYGDFDSSASK